MGGFAEAPQVVPSHIALARGRAVNVSEDQAATNAFLFAITGAAPIGKFMAPENLERLITAGKGA